jgi:arylsulfatase A-like enzyme
MTSDPARREARRRPSAAREIVRAGLVGGALTLSAHLAAVASLVEAPARDEASRRVGAELARLGARHALFAIALAGAVALAGGVVGAVLGAACRLALPRASARRRQWAAALLTIAVLLLLVVRAFLRQPALLEPSLGGARGALAPSLARLAATVAPWHVDVVFAVGGALLLVLAARAHGSRLTAIVGGTRTNPRRALAGLAGVAAIVLALSAIRWGPRLRRPPAPRLLVIAVDSLRPDRMAAVAPTLTALAARGVSFDGALSPIASTTPAWVSILTGLYPHHHGVRHMFPRRALRPAALEALPHRLARAGLRPVVASDYAGDFFPLFDFGFEDAALPPPLTLPLILERELVQRSPLALALLDHRLGRAVFPVLRFLMTNADPERLVDDAEQLLRDGAARARDREAALFVFFSTAHVPFAAPWPHYLRGDPRYGGRHRYAFDVGRLADVTASDQALPEADVRQIRALYDGAVAAVDAAAARLLRLADEHTLVLVLADHGENLFEPGQTTHHGKWFAGGDEANRVPLIFVGAGVPAGRRVSAPVSLVDVAPTVAALLGLAPPATKSDGVSLLPWLRDGSPPTARDVFAETAVWLAGPPYADGVATPSLPELLEVDPADGLQLVLKTRYEDLVVEAKHRMLRRGDDKLLYLPTKEGHRYLRYDLARDPHQLHDREASEPRPELRAALLRFLADDPERELDARGHLVRRSE